MSAPGAARQRSAVVRLAGIGLLAAGVAVVLYVAGRLHTPVVGVLWYTSALWYYNGFQLPGL